MRLEWRYAVACARAHSHTELHLVRLVNLLHNPLRSFSSVELHGRAGMAGSRRLVHFFTALCVFLCCSASVNGGKRGNSDKCNYKVKTFSTEIFKTRRVRGFCQRHELKLYGQVQSCHVTSEKHKAFNSNWVWSLNKSIQQLWWIIDLKLCLFLCYV